MARREISAGCVVYRRAGDGLEVALVQPRGREAWALPKGLVEAGESARDAAGREAREETGLEGRVLSQIDTIKYAYAAKWEDPPARIFKIVTFFLMEATGGDPAGHDQEIERVEWFPIDVAIRRASYSSEKKILRRAHEMLSARTE
jgi:ADP-ribose pyrophosphatase YjhB (NUDIX family)